MPSAPNIPSIFNTCARARCSTARRWRPSGSRAKAPIRPVANSKEIQNRRIDRMVARRAGMGVCLQENSPAVALIRCARACATVFASSIVLGITSVGDLQTRGVDFRASAIARRHGAHRRADVAGEFLHCSQRAGDELEQLKWRLRKSKKLRQSDMFRFAGFGEALMRGIGDGDLLSDPQGTADLRRSKGKVSRMAAVISPRPAIVFICTRRKTTPRASCSSDRAGHAATPLSRQRIVSPISKTRRRRPSRASRNSAAASRCRTAWC